MESEEKRRVHSSGGEGNGGVLVCHACGWAYSNPHPSAKQRRAHRKNCGKLAMASGSGRKGSDEEALDDEKSKKGGDGLMAEGGGGEEIKQNGVNAELNFVGSGRDGGMLEKDENLGINTGNNLDPCALLHGDGSQGPDLKYSKNQRTTWMHIASHVVSSNSHVDDADTTPSVLALSEETDYMKLQIANGGNIVVDVTTSATYAESTNDICMPELPIISGDPASASSEDPLLEKLAKYPEVAIPINDTKHTETQMKDFPADIAAFSKGLDLSLSCMEDEQTDVVGPLSQNLALCKALYSCPLEIDSSEHLDASVYSHKPEIKNGIPDNPEGEGDNKNLNALPMEAGTLLGKSSMQMIGSCQDNCSMELNSAIVSVGAKAEPEYHLGGRISKLILSESVMVNSDKSACDNSLDEKVNEVNPFYGMSGNASANNESNSDPNSLIRHDNGETTPSANFEYEVAVSVATFGGSKGLGLHGVENNLENSHAMAAELSRSQAIAQDNQLTGSLETCFTVDHLKEIEGSSGEKEANITHELILQNDTIASRIDRGAQHGNSHASETVKVDNEGHSFIQGGTDHNLFEMVIKACKEISSQSDTSSEYSEISFRDSHIFEHHSDQFNHGKAFDELFGEPADSNELNDHTLQEVVEIKHDLSETSLSKAALGIYESQNGYAENVSGPHLPVRNHHQDSSIESAVGTDLDSEINCIVGVTSEKKKSNEDDLVLCHQKTQEFSVEGHVTSLLDTEPCITKSVAFDDAKTDTNFDAIPSGDCHQNLPEDQFHVVSNQQPALTDYSIYSNSHSSNFEGKQDSISDDNAPAIRHTANGLPSHETQTPAHGSTQTIKDLCTSGTAEENSLQEINADRSDAIAAPSRVIPASLGRKTISDEIHAEDESEGKEREEDINGNVVRWKSGKAAVPLKALLAEASLEANLETAKAEEQTTSSKKRRAKKDDSSTKSSASSKRSSDHQEWDSPARLPLSKNRRKPKVKQPWVPFLCCPSVK